MADETNAAADTAAPDAEAAYKATIAEMLAAEKAAAEGEKKPPAEKKDEPAGEEATTDEDDDTEEEGEDKPESEGEDDEEEEGEGEEEEPKGKYSKALRTLQKEKESLQAFKATVLREQKAVAAEREQLKATQTEVRSFVAALKRDPHGTLLKAGLLNEAELDHYAKQLHFMSPEALKDPRSRAEAERLRREWDRDRSIAEQRAEVERLRKERDAELAEKQQAAELDRYVAKVNTAAEQAKTKTPELAKALAKNADRTQRELLMLSHELSQAKGELADPKLVVLAWTKRHKAEAEYWRTYLAADSGTTTAAATPAGKKAKSTKPAEQKGATDAAKKTEGTAQSKSDADAEAAYQRKLAAMLKGEAVD